MREKQTHLLLGANARLVAGLVVAVALTAPGSAAGETPVTDLTGGAPVTATLSNLTTVTRWAYPQAEAGAHVDPSSGSRVVGRLHFLTSDGQAQVYVALRSYTLGRRTWVLVPLPGRPNGRTGWVPAQALGELQIDRYDLRINRETTHAVLYRAGRVVWSAPIGVGRPSLPTPAGHYYVTEKLVVLDSPAYGPYALGTSAYAPTLSEWPGGGVVGIHGTDEPALIPGHPSHGCIRMRNADISALWHMIGPGTPIEIV